MSIDTLHVQRARTFFVLFSSSSNERNRLKAKGEVAVVSFLDLFFTFGRKKQRNPYFLSVISHL